MALFPHIPPRPTVGKLVYKTPGGQTIVLESNKPFPKLQELKKEYIMRGYKKAGLRVTY